MICSGCNNTKDAPLDSRSDTSDTDDRTGPDQTDEDGDGVSPELGDCDDHNPDVYQGNEEDCNGVDDNCNGLTDEAFADTDGDGDADCVEVEDCDGLDNDGDGLIDEGFDTDGDGLADCPSPEICDGLDNDSDGLIDEDFDEDGDGYAPCGDAADCDDLDPRVSPGATELSATEEDEDCDGLIDEQDWATGDLLINEVMANPFMVADPFGEWLEILNVSDRRVYLDGLTLRLTAGAASLATGARLALEPGALFVLGSNADESINGGLTLDLEVVDLELLNGFDELSLEADGLVLDALDWTNASPGVAWSRDLLVLDSPSAWCDAVNAWGSETDLGSPGEANPLCPQVDHDDDGASLLDGDCEDLDPAIGPHAVDTWYDGIDQDCGGDSDFDADQDAYDDQRYGGDDCDDADAAINPGAQERCDPLDVDEDCDGLSDAADSSALGTFTALIDADGDGYGDDSLSSLVCELSAGSVEVGGDCLDSDADVHPGATEIWYDGVDSDCDGDSDYDADGDGYDAEEYGGLDCDDTSRAFRPGAWETWYDGVDNNCDGASDFDRDEDGYDSDRYGGTDCNDGRDDINPGVSEVCDPANTDEDCDGLADDLDTVAYHTSTWYQDRDGDGYGDGASTLDACDAPSGYSSDDTDCDDLSAAISPGAREIWYDGVDGDCDRESDYDADGDGADSVVYGGDDCDDSDPDLSPHTPELLGDGVDNDCDGLTDPLEQYAKLTMASASSALGSSVAGAGDVNGDGVRDLLLGAWYHDSPATNAGAAVLFTSLSRGTSSSATATALLTGSATSDCAGSSVAGAGDMDGDGYDDLIVGASGDDSGGGNSGAAYVIAGPVSGTSTLTSIGDRLSGENAADSAGTSVSGAGDLDDDGFDDVIVGAPNRNSTSTDSGGAYLVLGPVTTSASLGSADAFWVGDGSYDYAGRAARGCDDMDGDGLPDLLVGLPHSDLGATSGGAAALLLGPATAGGALVDADAFVIGEETSGYLGSAVACGGDTDGDGYGDLLLGAYGTVNGRIGAAGAAWVLSGPVSGVVSSSTAGLSVRGGATSDWLGYSLDLADVDGDGLSDLLIGAIGIDRGSTGVGAFFMVFGGRSGSLSIGEVNAQLYGSATSDALGTAVGNAGDYDGDGDDDVLIGIPGDDAGASNAGAALLLVGAGW